MSLVIEPLPEGLRVSKFAEATPVFKRFEYGGRTTLEFAGVIVNGTNYPAITVYIRDEMVVAVEYNTLGLEVPANVVVINPPFPIEALIKEI